MVNALSFQTSPKYSMQMAHRNPRMTPYASTAPIHLSIVATLPPENFRF